MKNNDRRNLLLVGNPNVGKSVLFSRLTGTDVIVSNYPGTTVDFSVGSLALSKDETVNVLDVPGIYNLDVFIDTDQVALNMLEKGDVLVNVLDATNLERNLFLTLELREKGVPMVVALNLWDETKHNGIEIDTAKLSSELGLPVVATCGHSGQGVKELVEKVRRAEKKSFSVISREEKWKEVGRITAFCQKLHHHHHTFLERLEDLSTAPLTGIPIAIGVIYLSFLAVRSIGEGLINHLLDPIFRDLWLPLVAKFGELLGGKGIVYDVLIGKMAEGTAIDFGKSFGLLTTGVYVPLVEVLPYITSFYFVLSLMEDFGYLPRLATQVDNIMHKLGLHGYAVIPVILGLGCNVPGAMALRLLEGRREKFIAGTLLAIAVPCMAQTAVIVGLVGQRGGQYLGIIFGTLVIIFLVKGFILNKVMKGSSPEILIEIPPYRIPKISAIVKKLWMRVVEFVKEAMPLVFLGVIIVNLLYLMGVFAFMGRVLAPVVEGLWGLPKETISAMMIGLLRKDLAVGMLGPLDLSTKQLVIACTILAVYFPCLAAFIALVRELGLKDMLKAAGLMCLTALTVGTILNLIM